MLILEGVYSIIKKLKINTKNIIKNSLKNPPMTSGNFFKESQNKSKKMSK